MSIPPRITAVITIVETKEAHDVEFVDADAMMVAVLGNVEVAKVVLNRNIGLKDSHICGDQCSLTFAYVDTGKPYMTVIANHHSTH